MPSRNVRSIVISGLPLPVHPAAEAVAREAAPNPPDDESTDARHLRRVLRNLCGRLAVGQHSRRIKIPCRTCRASRIAEVFADTAKVPNGLSSQPFLWDKGRRKNIDRGYQ
ncbi:hypothetical protein KM043_011632 [Ampulex compressa]|nr:hypothetical protein KM043_011632 [Ampulex compressa]